MSETDNHTDWAESNAYQWAAREQDDAYNAPEDDGPTIEDRFRSYKLECESEACEPLTFHMWTIHGEPDGPLY